MKSGQKIMLHENKFTKETRRINEKSHEFGGNLPLQHPHPNLG